MHGIFWGFLAGALNTAWWSIRWIALVLGEWETVAWFVHWGGLADPLTKGPIAYAAYYHLKAIRVGSLRKRKGK